MLWKPWFHLDYYLKERTMSKARKPYRKPELKPVAPAQQVVNLPEPGSAPG